MTAALLAVLLVAAKYALDAVPNVELVSLLLILYTLEFPGLVLPALYTYVMLYGLMYGMGVWWFPQWYVWLVLVGAARLLRRCDSAVLWAVVSGAFGLSYGALYAVSYAVLNGGIAAGFAWWVAGIPFDLLHCAGNFAAALLLYRPLRTGIARCKTAAHWPD